MELTHDWRSFQRLFYPKRKALAGPDSQGKSAYVIIENDTIVSAHAPGTDVANWIGSSFSELKASQDRGRKLVSYSKQDVDKWLMDSIEHPNFYAQMEYFRAESRQHLRRHFLIEALLGWWSKVLPSTYGMYIGVEDRPEHSLLLVVRKGSCEGFFRPDLSFLKSRKRDGDEEVVRYLAEKYLIPIQGAFVKNAEWEEWTSSGNAWPAIARAIRTSRMRLVPFRWGAAFLVSLRAFFRV